MAKVEVNKTFTMSIEEVTKGMQEMAESLASEHGMNYRWEGDSEISFKHKAGKGSLKIVGQELRLSIKLSMMYSAMAPVIKKRIVDWSEEYIY